MQDAFDVEKERYGFEEIYTDEAKAFITDLEKKHKEKAKAAAAAAKK